jgi:hypothetical protein
MSDPKWRGAVTLIFVALCMLLLSLLAAFNQIKARGLSWQEAHYLPRIQETAALRADHVWEYRWLSHTAAAGLCAAAERAGLPRPAGLVFVAVRTGLNLLIMGLALWYWRRFGISIYAGLLGLSVLAWAMTRVNYGSDLALSVSTEIAFFLLAAVALQARRPLLLLPLAAVAALNRETALLLPFLALAGAFESGRRHQLHICWHAVFAASLFICGAVMLCLHLLFTVPETPAPPVFYLIQNLNHLRGWGDLAGALCIAPVLALACWRAWPTLLRYICGCLIPLWFVWHYAFTPLAQPSVLLLPLVLVFLPGTLCAFNRVPEPAAAAEMTS